MMPLALCFSFLIAARVVIASPRPVSLNSRAIGLSRGSDLAHGPDGPDGPHVHADHRAAYSGLAWSAGSVDARLIKQPRMAVWLERATGIVFIATAARLALAERK